ncbi:MAG: hypothetical protein DRI91_01790 [Aquificota bacterium]|nr:MAG: hypothetical protein DRI91_01790 [Aquificota bacterium]
MRERFFPGPCVSHWILVAVFLAQGYYNPHSQIACRVFTFSERPLDASFIRRRLLRALELRKQSLPPQTTG